MNSVINSLIRLNAQVIEQGDSWIKFDYQGVELSAVREGDKQLVIYYGDIAMTASGELAIYGSELQGAIKAATHAVKTLVAIPVMAA